MLKTIEELDLIEMPSLEGPTTEMEEWAKTAKRDADVHMGRITEQLDALGMRKVPARPHYRYYFDARAQVLSRKPIGYIQFQKRDPGTGDMVDIQEAKGPHIKQVGGDALVALVEKQQAAYVEQQKQLKAKELAKASAPVPAQPALAAKAEPAVKASGAAKKGKEQ